VIDFFYGSNHTLICKHRLALCFKYSLFLYVQIQKHFFLFCFFFSFFWKRSESRKWKQTKIKASSECSRITRPKHFFTKGKHLCFEDIYFYFHTVLVGETRTRIVKTSQPSLSSFLWTRKHHLHGQQLYFFCISLKQIRSSITTFFLVFLPVSNGF
jgi:hypothetical protein